jgi:hypothetical protein
MLFNPELHGEWARQRIELWLETQALLRLARPPAQSFRQAIGHQFIRIGARLAAEPSLESVRSR